MCQQNWIFRHEKMNTAPRMTCRNRERCAQSCRGISHVWYRGTNKKCAITRSITSKESVGTNSNGYRSIGLVSRTLWTSHTYVKSFLAPILEVLKCSHPSSSMFDLMWLEDKWFPHSVIGCCVHYHDAWYRIARSHFCWDPYQYWYRCVYIVTSMR